MDTTKELTHISLCAGYGGIDLGLKRVLPNMRTVAYSEIEAYAVANLVAKMEAGLLDVAPIWTDLKTFPFVEFRGRVDILSGGFPCQPFSAAGRRRGDEDPRHLFPYIKRGIALLRPSVVFLENVEGIISSKLGEGWSDRKGTSVLLHVLRELERLDYKATAGIFSAREVGAPQKRRRVFILGVSNDSRNAFRELSTRHDQNIFKSDTERSEPQNVGYAKSQHGQRTATTYQKIYVQQIGESSLSDAWPAYRGQNQKSWEPRRVFLDHSNDINVQDCDIDQSSNPEKIKRQETSVSPDAKLHRRAKPMDTVGDFKSKVGRNFNGSSHWMDYGDLCESVCNRTDELRLLGNGVVPATATRAFRVLWEELGSL